MDTLKDLVLEEEMSEERKAAIFAYKFFEKLQHELEMMSHAMNKPEIVKAMNLLESSKELKDVRGDIDEVIEDLNYADFIADLEELANGE